MTGSVHVVIVNWNTGAYLRECLRSIADSGGASLTRVTVVDNASSDGSAESLDEFALDLEVIRNSTNVGFGAASNQGATGSDADYLLFLNPDTRLRPRTLAAVTAFMDEPRSDRIGICGVRVFDQEGRPGISCGRFPTLRVVAGKVTGLHSVLPRVFPRHHLPPAETQESRVVDQIIGAFFFVRRDLFERLGGFATCFFIYYEEVDLALRARRLGFESYLLADAAIEHAENVSSDQVRDLRLYHSLHSRLLYARRHWSRWETVALAFLTFAVELPGRLIVALALRRGTDAAAAAYAWRRLLVDRARGGVRSASVTADP